MSIRVCCTRRVRCVRVDGSCCEARAGVATVFEWLIVGLPRSNSTTWPRHGTPVDRWSGGSRITTWSNLLAVQFVPMRRQLPRIRQRPLVKRSVRTRVNEVDSAELPSSRRQSPWLVSQTIWECSVCPCGDRARDRPQDRASGTVRDMQAVRIKRDRGGPGRAGTPPTPDASSGRLSGWWVSKRGWLMLCPDWWDLERVRAFSLGFMLGSGSLVLMILYSLSAPKKPRNRYDR